MSTVDNKNWKYYFGISFVILSILPYIVVFGIMPFLNITKTESLSIATVLLVASELFFLGAIALLGKEFIQAIKDKIRALFHSTTPRKKISKTRFAIGLTLFIITMAVPTVLMEFILYFDYIENIGFKNTLYILFSFDILFIISLFILGGEFLERIKNLFSWPKEVV